MKVTKKQTAEQLLAYLHHAVSLPQLVDWAENALMNAEFDPTENAVLADTLARLGVADVREFGLTWEDCETLLERLGYRARIEIEAA